jgi:hypothetical protein
MKWNKILNLVIYTVSKLQKLTRIVKYFFINILILALEIGMLDSKIYRSLEKEIFLLKNRHLLVKR